MTKTTHEPRMTIQQIAIINILPTGNTNPMPASVIADKLGVTKRTINGDVATLINVFHIPIGSKRNGKAGYYLIENNKQRDETLTTLYAQTSSMNERVHVLETIDIADFWANKKSGTFA